MWYQDYNNKTNANKECKKKCIDNLKKGSLGDYKVEIMFPSEMSLNAILHSRRRESLFEACIAHLLILW